MADPSPGPAPGSRRAGSRGGLVLLGALSAFGPLSMDLYLPGLPQLQRELGAGQASAQLTLTSVSVGLAVGQLLAGPLSDRVGRRGPALVGLAAYALASALCALSPDVWVLVAVRLLQGVAGAAGIVLSRAVVRDRYEGLAAARAFAVLASINGAAPVLAPLAGGQLLRVTDWRGVFGALAVIGGVLLVWSLRGLPESLPPDRRARGGSAGTWPAARALLAQRAFLGPVLGLSLGFGALFTYISTSSFVLEDGFGLTPVQFSLVFGLNGLGIVAAGQVSAAVVGRAGPHRLMAAGLAVEALGCALLLVAAAAGWGLPVVLPTLFAVVSAVGLVLPNATALAMSGAPQIAGTASALLGLAQFGVGAVGAPLAGLGTAGALLPMALVMTVFAVLGWSSAVLLTRGRRGRAPDGEIGPPSRPTGRVPA